MKNIYQGEILVKEKSSSLPVIRNEQLSGLIIIIKSDINPVSRLYSKVIKNIPKKDSRDVCLSYLLILDKNKLLFNILRLLLK